MKKVQWFQKKGELIDKIARERTAHLETNEKLKMAEEELAELKKDREGDLAYFEIQSGALRAELDQVRAEVKKLKAEDKRVETEGDLVLLALRIITRFTRGQSVDPRLVPKGSTRGFGDTLTAKLDAVREMQRQEAQARAAVQHGNAVFLSRQMAGMPYAPPR